MRTAPSYCSRIRGNCPKLQPKSVEDLAIGIMHDAIGAVEAFDAGMKGIGVFHHKFTGSHDAEAGPDLVTKFGLDLIKGDRQLTIALDLTPNYVRYHFFMRWAKAEIAFMPVLDF